MRWLFGLLVLVFRGDQAKDAELLVLRHENTVLRRNAGRVRYEPSDRAWFAALARIVARWRWSEVFPCHARDAPGLAPQAGHEEIRHERAAQARPSSGHPGYQATRAAPGAGESAVGPPPIQGELLKFGIAVAPSTVWEILHAQATGILAGDFLHMDTVLLNRLYVSVTWNYAAGQRFHDHDDRLADLDPTTACSGHTGGFQLPCSSSLLLEHREGGPLIGDHPSPARRTRIVVTSQIPQNPGVYRAWHPPDAPWRRHRQPDRRVDRAASTESRPQPRPAVRRHQGS